MTLFNLIKATITLKTIQKYGSVELIFAKLCKELELQISDVEASLLFAETGTLDMTTTDSFDTIALII